MLPINYYSKYMIDIKMSYKKYYFLYNIYLCVCACPCPSMCAHVQKSEVALWCLPQLLGRWLSG